jgi:hypothetical protein
LLRLVRNVCSALRTRQFLIGDISSCEMSLSVYQVLNKPHARSKPGINNSNGWRRNSAYQDSYLHQSATCSSSVCRHSAVSFDIWRSYGILGYDWVPKQVSIWPKPDIKGSHAVHIALLSPLRRILRRRLAFPGRPAHVGSEEVAVEPLPGIAELRRMR